MQPASRHRCTFQRFRSARTNSVVPKGSSQSRQVRVVDLQDGLEIIGPEKALDIRTDVVAEHRDIGVLRPDPDAHPLRAKPAVEKHPFGGDHGVSIGLGRDSSLSP